MELTLYGGKKYCGSNLGRTKDFDIDLYVIYFELIKLKHSTIKFPINEKVENKRGSKNNKKRIP